MWDRFLVYIRSLSDFDGALQCSWIVIMIFLKNAVQFMHVKMILLLNNPQIIRSSAPLQNCGDLEGLLSDTWRHWRCYTLHVIQDPLSDLWRLLVLYIDTKLYIRFVVTLSYCGLYNYVTRFHDQIFGAIVIFESVFCWMIISWYKVTVSKTWKIGNRIMKSLIPKKTWKFWG